MSDKLEIEVIVTEDDQHFISFVDAMEMIKSRECVLNQRIAKLEQALLKANEQLFFQQRNILKYEGLKCKCVDKMNLCIKCHMHYLGNRCYEARAEIKELVEGIRNG